MGKQAAARSLRALPHAPARCRAPAARPAPRERPRAHRARPNSCFSSSDTACCPGGAPARLLPRLASPSRCRQRINRQRCRSSRVDRTGQPMYSHMPAGCQLRPAPARVPTDSQTRLSPWGQGCPRRACVALPSTLSATAVPIRVVMVAPKWCLPKAVTGRLQLKRRLQSGPVPPWLRMRSAKGRPPTAQPFTSHRRPLWQNLLRHCRSPYPSYTPRRMRHRAACANMLHARSSYHSPASPTAPGSNSSKSFSR